MEPRPEDEPHYEALPPGKRGLLIGLLYHLKDRLGLELQEIAKPARSVTINDYCRRSAPKAEAAIFRGVYRTVKAHTESLSPWARAAFVELYGEKAEADPPSMAELISQLFPYSVTDSDDLDRIAEAHTGIYAIYHYRHRNSESDIESEIDKNMFDRSQLRIEKSAGLPGLEFTVSRLVVSYGRTKYHLESVSGFVIVTRTNLHMYGPESGYLAHGMIIFPNHTKDVPSFMRMMLRWQRDRGMFASRILVVRAEEGQEEADAFQPDFVSMNELPLGEINAERLRNSAPLDGRSILGFPH